MMNISTFGSAVCIFLSLFFGINQQVRGFKIKVSSECECGISYAKNRIVNGWTAEAHEFPWVITILNKHNLYCGGALINDRYILTAGHCVNWLNDEDITVKLGEHDRSRPVGIEVPIERSILHPKFFSHDEYDEHDIALIKLKSPVKFSNAVRPICLPLHKYSTYDDNYATVAGWGKQSFKGRSSNLLQYTIIRVLSDMECARTQMGKYITDTVMCGYYDNTDACQGDSGGPLFYEREPGVTEQIGVVSWGMGCATPNMPGIYTKVTSYLHWIYNTTRDAVYCQNT